MYKITIEFANGKIFVKSFRELMDGLYWTCSVEDLEDCKADRYTIEYYDV